MSDTVNIDFIGSAYMNKDGSLEYRRFPIPKLFDEEMKSLEAMNENDNRTVMDLQDYFQRFMPQATSTQEYDYCAPNAYHSSFISKAKYPTILSFSEYQDKIKEAENYTISNFLSKHEVEAIDELTDSQKTELKAEIALQKDICKKELRDNFYNAAKRYINALRYYRELSKVKADANNRMYSTENIGWTTFYYPISNDILFFMKSNFGYGNSSYHFINLSYKGIDILPFSAIVKYYYVSMAEFYRYTRQYRPSHENWEVALDFVVETANLALQDANKFITQFIGNEIDEMVAGLKIISEQPKKSLKEFFSNPRTDTKFLYVRHATKADEKEYIAYPEEISTIFKAEKLSTALDLLDKLKALAPAYPKALEAIDKIKSLNVDFFPNLKEHIALIEADIKRRQELLKPKVEERDALKAKGKPHYDMIDKLIEIARKKGAFNFNAIRLHYLSEHPDFKKLHEDVEKRSEEISKDEHEISLRESFVRRLEGCKLLIMERLDIAA